MRNLRTLIWVLTASLLAGSVSCKKEQPVAPSPPAAPPPPTRPAPPPPPPDPATLEDEATTKKIAEVFDCFDRQMEAAKLEDKGLALYERNPFTDMFVFQSLIDRPAQLEQETPPVCDGLVARYRAAWRAELARRPAARRTNDLAPPDGSPGFLREVHNRAGLHALQHGDITRAAVRQVFPGKLAPVFEFVAFAAQQSDLYNKMDSRYHALYHRATLVGHLTVLWGKFAASVNEDNMATAAIFLGAICHMVQDAGFYKGMTTEALAGLQYVAGQDIHSGAAAADALRLTKTAVGLAREGVDNDAAWKRFLAWSPPPGLDFSASLRAVFGKTVPVDHALLTQHWLLHRSYKRFPERRKELENGTVGLAKWDPDRFVAEALGPGGVVQPAATREPRRPRTAIPTRSATP